MNDLHPLDGAFERVRRAEEHLVALRPLIDAMQRQHEQVLLTQLDANALHQGEIRARAPAPMRVPILVGEICYNLQGALDYLVFELAKYDARAPQENTQFPVVKKPKNFRSECAKRLKGVNSRHVEMIERLQPYNGCDWIRILRWVSNRDKHREFVAARSGVSSMVYAPSDPEYAGLALPIRRLGEMDVKVDLSCTVCFADGSPVIETLEEIKLKVFEALAEFRAEFK